MFATLLAVWGDHSKFFISELPDGHPNNDAEKWAMKPICIREDFNSIASQNML